MEATIASKKKSKEREPGERKPGAWRTAPMAAAAAFTIDEFCAAHRLSPEMYFKLKADGLGPREMLVGSRRMISAEAARRWVRQREAAARRPEREAAAKREAAAADTA